jgi:hypothetical protein
MNRLRSEHKDEIVPELEKLLKEYIEVHIWTKKDNEDLAKYINLPWVDLGKYFGVSRDAVRRHAESLGLKKNKMLRKRRGANIKQKE